MRRGKSHVRDVLGGTLKWLSTRVIILGDNRELLSFTCCLETGNRKKYPGIAVSGLFVPNKIFVAKPGSIRVKETLFSPFFQRRSVEMAGRDEACP